MRYYSIQIIDNFGRVVPTPSSVTTDATYTSFVNNQSIPAALNIEFNIPVVDYVTPTGAAWVRIYGVSLKEILLANTFVGNGIKLFAGMQKGLPLAKPGQSGLILNGTVQRAFGNWVGTQMTVDLICSATVGSTDDPLNIVLNWKKGQALSDALKATLQTAFPGKMISINTSPNLVFTDDVVGIYNSLWELNQVLLEHSTSILGSKNYLGVRIIQKQDGFAVYDGTSQSSPIQIAFDDLIGQPTWIDPLTVQFICPVRADLKIGDYIKFPPSLATNSIGGSAPLGSGIDQQSLFQGTWLISGPVIHNGNFRQPDASAWNSTFNATSVSVPSGAA